MDDVKFKALRYKVGVMIGPAGDVIQHSPPVTMINEASFDAMEADRNAQRLRADTAEAERDAAKAESKALAELDDVTIANLGSRLKAADQRIGRFAVLLRRADDFMYIMTGSDPEKHFNKNWEAAIEVLRGEIAAALNPKPEAGSHESN